MSASMRNALQRRNHKERSQPSERAKWGLLEKKKDYQLRSRDYNAKKRALAALKAKASLRNPDEFNFGMINARTSKGVKITQRGDVGGTALDNDVVKVMKTQDAGYIRVLAGQERAKIRELEEGLGFIGEGGGGERHTVFVDGEEEARSFDAKTFFDTEEGLVERGWNRLRREQIPLVREEEVETAKKERVKMAKERRQKYRELEARMRRLKDLEKMEREVEEQKARMGKERIPKDHKKMGAKVRKR
jgi:U3 small nucleolar RNA-associated protein 11